MRERDEWKFFAVLPKADAGLAWAWWLVLLLRGALPAVLAVAMGWLIGAVQAHSGVAAPLVVVGAIFVLLQVLPPMHSAIGANLGDKTAAWLYDRLTQACVRPPGMAHLEDPKLIADLTVARDFDLGMTGPPLNVSLDFIAVDPPASKELRLFGLAGWVIERFVNRRTRLHDLQYQATRLRERPVLWSLLIVSAGNLVVFWAMVQAVASGSASSRAR